MKVSVVIPCYNAEAYLAQTVGSVLEQSLAPGEVIVVDDGSKDASLSVARRCAAADDRVRVIAQRSGSAPIARNVGAMESTGEALMFLDADDVVGPGTLEALAGGLAGRSAAVARCPWRRLQRVEGRWVDWPASCRPAEPGEDPLSAWLTGHWTPPVAVLWTREGYERSGRWDPRALVNNDGDIMMRALAAGVELVEVSDGCGYYRRLPGEGASLSGRRGTPEGLTARVYVLDKLERWLAERGAVEGHRDALRRAYEGLAAEAAAGSCAAARRLALRGAARHGGSAVRRAAREGRRLMGRAVTRAREAAGGRSGSGEAPASAGEITHGLAWAAKLGASSVEAELTAMNRPRVTVIVPTYNRVHLIDRALDSVFAQTFTDYELLVVDDGSTDGTAERMAAIDDPRLRYLPQPVNGGVSAARNRGLREARAELIAFLDSDDEWFPEKLAKQVARFDTLDASVGVLYGGVENDDTRGTRRVFRPEHRGDLRRVLLGKNVIHGTSGVMMRRDVVACVGFFDEGIPAIEDYDYWLRVADFYEFDYVDEALIRYYESPEETRKTLNRQENHDAREWLYRKHGEQIRRAGLAAAFLAESGRRYLRGGEPGAVARARELAWRALRASPGSADAWGLLRWTMKPAGSAVRGGGEAGAAG